MDALNKSTILITGANGQLGQEFGFISNNYTQFNFIFADRNTLDICNQSAVNTFFKNNEINCCVNCAAYTAVDKAESEAEAAMLANATAVGYLAAACKNHNATFIHISTDYVFDGTNEKPYLPTDKTNPINFYGQTKLNGEQQAIAQNADTIIIRTAWVYSSVGNNFVKTMLRLMSQKETIGVVSDQFGAPTYAADLADAIMQIIVAPNKIPGIYHYSNKGQISWYDFATEIATQINTTCVVNPIATSQFPTPAKRPAFSVLSTTDLENNYNIQIKDWKESLKQCLQKIRSINS